MTGITVLSPALWSHIKEITLLLEGNNNRFLTKKSLAILANICENFFAQRNAPLEIALKTEYEGIAFARSSGRVISHGRQTYTVEIAVDYSQVNSLPFRLVGRYPAKKASQLSKEQRKVFTLFFTITTHFQGGAAPCQSIS